MVLDSLVFLVLLAHIPGMPTNRPSNAELAQQVRAAEVAFARSMADRDHAAFMMHLADEAVFFGSRDVARGKEAVAAQWKPLFEGKEPPYAGGPREVEVLDSGTLGISSGPIFGPDGKQSGTYNSIWRLESDGHWRVIFDKGCPPSANGNEKP